MDVGGPEIVVAGHVCLDLRPRLHGASVPEPGQLSEVGPLAIRPGGCVANTGLGLAALGATVGLAAAVGDDHLGRLLCDLIVHERADASGVAVHAGADTSYSVVVEPPGGDRSFWHHVGSNASFDAAAVEATGAAMLHLGYPSALPLLCADGGQALTELLDRTRAVGATTSIDLATFSSWSSAARQDWPALLGGVLPRADVFSASLDDLRCAYGGQRWVLGDPQAIARELVVRGAAIALVKAGAGGLHLATAGVGRLGSGGRGLAGLGGDWAAQSLHAPSVEIEVASTTGAGDAAVAGLLYGVLRAMSPGQALRAAAVVAAAHISVSEPLQEWPDLWDRLGSRSLAVDGLTKETVAC